MKKLILIMMVLFIASSIPAEAQIARVIDRISYKMHMNKRHRAFKKLHKKNVKMQRKLQSSHK